MEERVEAERAEERAAEVKVEVRVAVRVVGERGAEGAAEETGEARVAGERVEARGAEERVELRGAGEREAEMLASREALLSMGARHSLGLCCSRLRMRHPGVRQWGRGCPGSAPSSSVAERPWFSASGGVVPCS